MEVTDSWHMPAACTGGMLALSPVLVLCNIPSGKQIIDNSKHKSWVTGSLNYKHPTSMAPECQQSTWVHLMDGLCDEPDTLDAKNKHMLTHRTSKGQALRIKSLSSLSEGWEDNSDKKNPNLLDFSQSTEQAISMDGWLKPSWELVLMTQRQIQSGACSSSGLDFGSPDIGYNRLSWLNERESSAKHQSSNIGGYSGITPAGQQGSKKRSTSSVQGFLRNLCKEGRLKEALHLLELMDQAGIQACSSTYASLLHACMKIRNIAEGKRIHAHIIKSGFKLNAFLGSTLVNLYAKCGSMVDARQVFDEMSLRNVFTWTMIIAGYVRHGNAEEALELFRQMEGDGVKPNEVTFVTILKACCSLRDLEQGKQIHAQIIKSGFESDEFVRSTLVDMYAKCGSLEHAYQVFNKMPKQNVVMWTAMMSGYTQHKQPEKALKLFSEMEQEGVKPNKFTFVIALKACARLQDLENGKQIHASINRVGLELDAYMGSALVDMYAKCSRMEDAHQVFDKLYDRDVVVWTAMIAGYVQHGNSNQAIKLFQQMQKDGVKPNEFTFVAVIKAYASLGNLEEGIQVHFQIIESGYEDDVVLGAALINMYAKYGSIELACQVFDKMPKKNVISWGAMIAGHVHCGNDAEALELFWQMERQGINPDEATYLGVLKACASLKALKLGKQIHTQIIEMGVELNSFVGSALIDMYVKSGSIVDARGIFDKISPRDVVLFSEMIAGYAQHGYGNDALRLFQQMSHDGIQPNEFTFIGLLKACSILGDLEQGKKFHALICERGFESDIFVGSTLVDMYMKCSSIKHALQVFGSMPERNVVSWTAMISGYAQHGWYEEAFNFFEQMQVEGIQPNEFTLVTVLNACANLEDIEKCKQVHDLIIKYGFESDVFVASTLVDMYAKRGNIDEARQVFDKIAERDVVLWTAMIAGYAKFGNSKEVFELFWQMELEGVKPNEITFIVVLKLCANLAALEEGKRIHAYIILCGFESDVSVRCSIIDMYAKCKCIELAWEVFDELSKEDVALWNAMIAGYAQCGHGSRALRIFEQMREEGVKPNNNTFMGILSACNNAGLVDKGHFYFNSMSRDYDITPTGEHYTCMADLLVRAGRFKEASSFLKHAMLT